MRVTVLRRLLPGVCLIALWLLTAAAPVHAQLNISITYNDSEGEGFYDASLGELRRAAFEYAVDIWSNQLEGNVTVVIRAQFDPLGGSSSSAVLGSTSAPYMCRDFPGAPLANTWYPATLALKQARIFSV